MKTLRGIIIGLVVGAVAGLWAGFNAGRDAPLTANPFQEYGIADRLETDAGELYDKLKKDISK